MSRVRNVLLFLMVVVSGLSIWAARREADRPGATAERPARDATITPQAGAASIHVAVLNGTGEAGLARRASRRLPAFGCVVVAIGDAPVDTFPRTMLVNRRLDDERLDWLAMRLSGPVVVTEWDDRCDEDVVLVLGRDHESKLPATRGQR